MPELLLSVVRFIRLLLCGHQAIAIENAALRPVCLANHRAEQQGVGNGPPLREFGPVKSMPAFMFFEF